MGEYLRTIRMFSPSLRRFLLAIGLVAMVAFGLIAVLLNLYLLRLGMDTRFIGLLIGMGQLAWALSALPAGILSNHIGMRVSMQAGSGIFGLGLALFLLVENLPEAQWRTWLLACQILMYVGVALLSVNMPPYVMAVTQERERRHAFASMAALIPAAAFLGSLIAGATPAFVAQRLGLSLDMPAPYRIALWLGPVLCWIGMLPLFGADPARIDRHGGATRGTRRPPYGLLVFFAALTFFAAIGEGTVRAFFNVYLDEGLGVAPTAIGLIMGIAQLLPIAVAMALPPLLARWGTGVVYLVGTLGIAMCLLPLAAVPAVWVAALAYMGVIAFAPVTGTARDIFGQELVSPRWRTSSQGVAMIGMALGWSAAGVIGGALIEVAGFSALYLAGALAGLVAAAILLAYLRVSSRRTQRWVEPPGAPQQAMAPESAVALEPDAGTTG